MKRYTFPAIIEQDEDGLFVGIVPDLKGCHTQAKSLTELDKRLREAVALCVSAEKPKIRQNKFIGVHQLDIAV